MFRAVALGVGSTRDDDMRHFVVVYDRRFGLRDIQRFTDEEHDQAVKTWFALEDEHRDESDLEVVLLSAASEDVIRHTHGRYFKTLAELATLE
jgi:hypothetical protein